MLSDKAKERHRKTWDGSNYKTYDTSNGHGNPDQWRDAFEQRMHFKILTPDEINEHEGLMTSIHIAKDAVSLKKAYYALMIVHHPDKNNGSEESKVITQLISDTYFELKKKFTK